MWVLGVLAWIGVVAAGSALTWVAIDRAGNQVSGGTEPSSTEPAAVGTIGTAPTTPSSTPTRTAAPTTSAPTHGATTTSTPTPTTNPTRRPSSTPTRSTVPQPHAVSRTWSGAAGTVTVACTSRTAQLKGTSPADGWHVEVNDASGAEIEVKFERSESEVQVKATCVDGVPRFQVESGGESGDDD